MLVVDNPLQGFNIDIDTDKCHYIGRRGAHLYVPAEESERHSILKDRRKLVRTACHYIQDHFKDD